MGRTVAASSLMVGRQVTCFERFSNAIFGSPSIRRANGGFKVRFMASAKGGSSRRQQGRSKRGHDGSIATRELANKVYQVDESQCQGEEKLPRIWITEKGVDGDLSNPSLRAYVASYPNGTDEGGLKALELAERMLGEGFGMSEVDPDDRKLFFQAAEILLMHSVDRGNADAAIKLGDMYRFDLCKGSYWMSRVERRAKHAGSIDPVALARRAWILYGMAARKGSPVAHMCLGDMERESGREDAKARAFSRYMRAYDLMMERTHEHLDVHPSDDGSTDRICIGDEEKRIFGLILLRLAECFERAFGCRRNLTVAKKLYACSKMRLEEAFMAGCWHNKRDHIEACRGYLRCEQESAICSDSVARRDIA